MVKQSVKLLGVQIDAELNSNLYSNSDKLLKKSRKVSMEVNRLRYNNINLSNY